MAMAKFLGQNVQTERRNFEEKVQFFRHFRAARGSWKRGRFLDDKESHSARAILKNIFTSVFIRNEHQKWRNGKKLKHINICLN